jgi:CelD/BcsL family acetyltransferase involved in cellulose biosynthesis
VARFFVVESASELEALRAEWRTLAEGESNAFLTPEWFDASLDAYGEGVVPFVAGMRDDAERLLALAPLVRTGAEERRVIRFAGANLGDCFTALAREPRYRRALVRALGAELSRRRDWRALALENVPADSPWREELAKAGLSATRLPHRDEVLPFASIEGLGWDEYLARKSRNFRSQLGRKARALERDHDVSYRLVSREDELEAALETFARLHHARWDERGGSQALTERSRRFHEVFTRSALARGWLRLWLLEVDSDAVAAWYGWRVGTRYAYYLAGFDPSWGRHSVGLLLQAHTLKAAMEEGASSYDLLLGGEEYKGRFADGEAEVRSWVVTRRFSPARLAALGEVLGRRTADSLSPELRARVKRRLGGLARGSPSDVAR